MTWLAVRPTDFLRQELIFKYCDLSCLFVGWLVGLFNGVFISMCSLVSSHPATSCNGRQIAGRVVW